jgi:urease accessory protein
MHTTMRTTIRMTILTMATTTEPLSAAALLGLFQLTSPALPVGAFSYSDGLESAVARGWVTDEASVQTWLSDGLTLTLSRCDWPLLSRLHEAWSQGDVDLALRLSHGFAWLENQVQAAMKAVPLGQKSGQRLLHALARELVAAHEAFEALPEWPQPISAAPGLAILSAQHEHLYTRIFRS